jgi:uncharacterized protein YegL
MHLNIFLCDIMGMMQKKEIKELVLDILDLLNELQKAQHELKAILKYMSLQYNMIIDLDEYRVIDWGVLEDA